MKLLRMDMFFVLPRLTENRVFNFGMMGYTARLIRWVFCFCWFPYFMTDVGTLYYQDYRSLIR